MQTSPRFAYFGTPDFSTLVLDALADKGFLPVVVVSAPDRPAGRGLQLRAAPVKEWAQARNIPTLTPEQYDEETVASLAALELDLLIVAAYGKILPQRVLDLPKHGCLNVHPSLLPRYRGTSPIESQIRADEKEVGVSVIVMDAQMDHGPVLASEQVSFPEWPIARNVLTTTLWTKGGELLAASLPAFLAGELLLKAQDDAAATFTKKIRKEDGLIDLAAPGRHNYLQYLAYEGWPGTYFFKDEKRVKIVKARLEGEEFVIERVVPEGRHEISYEEFLRS